MKKFFLMATVVGAAFTSCVDDNEAVWQQEESSAKPITFEVAKYKPASRADGDSPAQQGNDGTVVFPTTESFGTFAYEKLYGATNTRHTLYMDNVKIVYYQNGNYWAPARTLENVTGSNGETTQVEKFYTWPTDAHLDFISYAPYQEDKSSSKVPKISNSDEQNTLMYQNYDIEADGATDLMYSDKAVWQTANSSYYGFTGVPTLFHHALAKLNFMVKAVKLNNYLTAISDAHKHQWEIIVHSIALNNIYKKGSVTMTTQSADVTSATTTEWTNSLLSNSATINYNVWNVNTSAGTTDAAGEGSGATVVTPYMQPKTWTNNQTLTTDARVYSSSSTTDAAQDYFVIPQTLSGQTITINYTIITKDVNGTVTNTATLTTPKVINFKEISSVPAWEMGKSITYIIEIDPEGDVIHFAPRVVDWEAQQGVISI